MGRLRKGRLRADRAKLRRQTKKKQMRKYRVNRVRVSAAQILEAMRPKKKKVVIMRTITGDKKIDDLGELMQATGEMLLNNDDRPMAMVVHRMVGNLLASGDFDPSEEGDSDA